MSITIHLRADGVSLLLHTDGGLPEARYWGADLGELTATDVGTQLERTAFTAELNNVQAQLRIALLPEGRTGWQGTPGLVGSRKGRGWTPDWRLVAALIDGAEAAEGLTTAGPCSVEFRAVADDAGLAVTLTVELGAEGLVRARAALTNAGADDYTVDQLTLAMPIPNRAGEVMDFGGRWGAEHVPQRFDLTVGTHRREARRGRTGPDTAYVLSAGRGASATTPARSGPCTPRGAATTSTTSSGSCLAPRCSGAANCSCPARACWRPATPTPRRGCSSTTPSGSTPRRRASTATCARGPHTRVARGP